MNEQHMLLGLRQLLHQVAYKGELPMNSEENTFIYVSEVKNVSSLTV